MLPSLPVYLSVIFGLLVILSIFWFYKASKSKTAVTILLLWAIIQSAFAYFGLYQDTITLPPKIMTFGVLPSFGVVILVLLSKKGKAFSQNINLKTLSYFHSIRIPVEIILSLLYHQGVLSIWMTMEGSNLDILSGLSAPIVAYLVFKDGRLAKRKLLLVWNVVCLLLLLNVVVIAILSMESPFQQISFDQATIAPFFFPFVLLPTVVVPLVIFSHLVAIRNLLSRQSKDD